MISLTKRQWTGRIVILLCFVFFVNVFAGGCEPLRKKFTRRKKKEKVQTDLPILEPMDYPEKVYSNEDLYKHHFSLSRVWYKELLGNIHDASDRKRNAYLAGQMIINLETAAVLLSDEKQKDLTRYIGRLKTVHKDLSRSALLKSISTIEIQLKSAYKRINRDFTLRAVQEDIRPRLDNP